MNMIKRFLLSLAIVLSLAGSASAQQFAINPCGDANGNCVGNGNETPFFIVQGGVKVAKVDIVGSTRTFSVLLPVTFGSNAFAAGAMTATSLVMTSDATARDFIAGNSRFFYWTGRALLASSADKIIQLEDNGATTGMEFSYGTPTLGTCTAGALVSGSHNMAGQYTSNTSGSCVINFGTPNFTNAPFCVAMSTASTTHPRISASAASSITVTGGVSGETITYYCIGRIGV